MFIFFLKLKNIIFKFFLDREKTVDILKVLCYNNLIGTAIKIVFYSLQN